jgi:hypothetical protein
MELPSYFNDFLAEIRPTDKDNEDSQTGHNTLRNRLENDEYLKTAIISTFLQGSYRRATALRSTTTKKTDVDIVVVTKLKETEFPNPEDAMNKFIPFLEKWYKGKYVAQGRSWGIKMTYVELDLVITSAPSEWEEGILKSESVTSSDTPDVTRDWRLNMSWKSVEHRSLNELMLMEKAKAEPQWKTEPLHIPDRDAKIWEPTHPLAQIAWTFDKNAATNGYYVNVVKALKWWRRFAYSTTKYPKGYPVEHIIGDNCPDGINSVAEGVTKTLENIANNMIYKIYADLNATPNFPDRGVPQHNVFARVSGTDFSAFYYSVAEAAKTARRALDCDDVYTSVKEWQKLFGDVRFPNPPEDSQKSTETGGFTARNAPTAITGGRFAMR